MYDKLGVGDGPRDGAYWWETRISELEEENHDLKMALAAALGFGCGVDVIVHPHNHFLTRSVE